MPDLMALKTMKHHWALLPVVAICGGAVVMCGSYIGYMCLTKNDISFKPRSWNSITAPYQSVQADRVNKLIKHHAPQIDPEVLALRRELGSYQS